MSQNDPRTPAERAADESPGIAYMHPLSDPERALIEHVAECRVISCSRCAYESTAYQDTLDDAIEYLYAIGWRTEGHRVFCPSCRITRARST